MTGKNNASVSDCSVIILFLFGAAVILWWELYLVPLALVRNESGRYGEAYGPVMGLRLIVHGFFGILCAICLVKWIARRNKRKLSDH